MQVIKDFNYFKSRSRKQPRSLSMVSLNSNDWEEYWNTKVIPQNGLNSKRMKLEQSEDQKLFAYKDIAMCVYLTDCIFIFCT